MAEQELEVTRLSWIRARTARWTPRMSPRPAAAPDSASLTRPTPRSTTRPRRRLHRRRSRRCRRRPDADEEERKPPKAVADPYEEFRAELRCQPGKWYVIHSYAGFERRVKANIEQRLESMAMDDYIYQVEVPMEDVVEIKNGQRKMVTRVRIPGYVLVRMDLNEESWSVVRHTPGVTGFVGNAHNPTPLRFEESFGMLKSLVEIKRGRAKGARPVQPRAASPPRSTSRSARPSPSRTARSRAFPARSARSSPRAASSRCSSRSSSARPRSSSASTRSPSSNCTATVFAPGCPLAATERPAALPWRPPTGGTLLCPDGRSREGKKLAPKKKVTGLIKLQIKAGAANPAPPIGPALGQHGVNIMEFCKAYNARPSPSAATSSPSRSPSTRTARSPSS